MQPSCIESPDNSLAVDVVLVARNPTVQRMMQSILTDSHIDVRVLTCIRNPTELAGREQCSRAGTVLIDATDRESTLALLHSRETLPSSRISIVVLVTGIPEFSVLAEFLRAGADGILTSSDDLGMQMHAMRSRPRPLCWVSPAIGAALLARTHREDPVDHTLAAEAQRQELTTVELTAAERLVLEYISIGSTDRRTAKLLNRSERTVKYHVTNLLSKFDAHNRAHLVLLAVGMGALDPSASPAPAE